jgi:protein-tyrosine phosphatase
MIDLHCHILPALDDGPPTLDASLGMARAAVADGVRTIVATPHVREDYPYEPSEVAPRTRDLNAALHEEGIPLEVVPGAEVGLTRALALSDGELREACLGTSTYLLVESPYAWATDLFEQDLFGLQVRGVKLVLAHPERSPSFIEDVDRLARIVERDVLCAVTAASLTGRFGRTVKRTVIAMFEAGLVHVVASDAHNAARRPPVLSAGFDALEPELPGLAARRNWLVSEVPQAILSDESPPRPRGEIRRTRGRRLRHALGRVGR